MRKRNHTVTIRMNKEEYDLFQSKVKESGRTQQEVVIKAIADLKIATAEEIEELKRPPPPPAEALPPHKAIAGEPVRHGNPVLRTDIQHLIRSVSHAPKQYGAPCLTLQVPPQVGRARIR